MATNAKSSSILPMASADPPPRVEEKLFKGSAMTKRGAYAAISYMTCAGIFFLSFNFFTGIDYHDPEFNSFWICLKFVSLVEFWFSSLRVVLQDASFLFKRPLLFFLWLNFCAKEFLGLRIGRWSSRNLLMLISVADIHWIWVFWIVNFPCNVEFSWVLEGQVSIWSADVQCKYNCH